MIHHSFAPLLKVPPVNPTAPPGMDGLTTILNWISWGVLIACVAGFLLGVGILVLSDHGPETKGGKRIIIALIGAVLVGAMSGIFAAFTG
ncbi:hypothetical protein CGZ93_10415 [Enemella dayhoffiae]|uniref:Uncharacterized protein n=1 Tax=Enemella dayhoffiae TaxID=2016507 RepID=A0A255H2P3_9ACTN|nr:hypothetical protein [Enemella dayhoffiae]OYO21483.1 hypothetical protein CGZ93_10415 [Enemella dayhoffiae]